VALERHDAWIANDICRYSPTHPISRGIGLLMTGDELVCPKYGAQRPSIYSEIAREILRALVAVRIQILHQTSLVIRI
jgi:hypothetical protein